MKNTAQVRKKLATKRAPVQTKSAGGADQEHNRARTLIYSPIDEARAATAQSSGLHWLLSEALFNQKAGVFGEETQFGITELIIATQDRIDRALASLEVLAESKEEVAS